MTGKKLRGTPWTGRAPDVVSPIPTGRERSGPAGTFPLDLAASCRYESDRLVRWAASPTSFPRSALSKLAAPLAVAFVLLTAACADSARYVRTDSAIHVHLAAADAVYVALPENGSYAEKVYPQSGRMMADAVLAAFSKHCPSVRSAGRVETPDEARASAQQGGEIYVAFSSILHWEDRATEWSARPDRIAVRIDLLDVATGEVVDSAKIEGKSGLGTFGGDHPQDLLDEPIGGFIDSLYEPGS